MSKPTKFGSNRLTNRDQSYGPMLEGSVSVATNYVFGLWFKRSPPRCYARVFPRKN